MVMTVFWLCAHIMLTFNLIYLCMRNMQMLDVRIYRLESVIVVVCIPPKLPIHFVLSHDIYHMLKLNVCVFHTHATLHACAGESVHQQTVRHYDGGRVVFPVINAQLSFVRSALARARARIMLQ